MSLTPTLGAESLERAAMRFASKDLHGAGAELNHLLACPNLTSVERGAVLHARAVVHMELGRLEQAAADLAAAARLLRPAGARFLGQVLDDAGVVDLYRGKLQRAGRTLAHALRCRLATGNTAGAARTYDHLGLAAIKTGRLDEVESYLLCSLTLWHQLGDADGSADAFDTFGRYYAARHDWSSSLAMHLHALRCRAASPDRYGRAKTLTAVGVALRHLGRPYEALLVHQECLHIRVRGQDPVGIANSRNALGLVLIDLGRFPAAQKQLRRALLCRLAMGDELNAERVRRNLSRLASERTKR